MYSELLKETLQKPIINKSINRLIYIWATDFGMTLKWRCTDWSRRSVKKKQDCYVLQLDVLWINYQVVTNVGVDKICTGQCQTKYMPVPIIRHPWSTCWNHAFLSRWSTSNIVQGVKIFTYKQNCVNREPRRKVNSDVINPVDEYSWTRL
jgi:hypothetical protein